MPPDKPSTARAAPIGDAAPTARGPAAANGARPDSNGAGQHADPPLPAPRDEPVIDSHIASAWRIARTEPRPDPAPLYHQVKQYVIGQIESGEWTAGQRVPSENEIVKVWGVSRQTANRALRELSSEGYLTRIQGVGSFVANSKYQAPALVVRSISDEVTARGHRYSARVIALEQVPASDFIAWALNLPAGGLVFHSVLLHYENDKPVQLEDRYVNPAAAPDYLSEDFTRVTPNQHLMKAHPPLSEVEETIEAVLPSATVCASLEIDEAQPCLVVRRRTWSGRLPVTQVTLTHPGNAYRLLLHFRPGESGA